MLLRWRIGLVTSEYSLSCEAAVLAAAALSNRMLSLTLLMIQMLFRQMVWLGSLHPLSAPLAGLQLTVFGQGADCASVELGLLRRAC